ncbi:hypothetical protein IWQ60_003925 [Tieghemiomyces parasiticus]|uniref:Extracellular metalloproteinase n=1 Tax=Tieghemiomyces parasiticus TaxID=78921 RepID=A0A9W8AF87_9FUNG|nr:hypothetical protein IWQ60_003925 [Tieghemiomyces parasiticus]
MRTVGLLTLALLACGTVVHAIIASGTRQQFFSPALSHRVYRTDMAVDTAGDTVQFANPVDAAIKLATSTYQLKTSEMVVRNFYTSKDTGISHVYLRQKFAGRDIDNADMNVNVGPAGNVISFGSTFLPASQVADIALTATDLSKVEAVSAQDAVNFLLVHLGLPKAESPLPVVSQVDGTNASDSPIIVTGVPGSVDPATELTKTYMITDKGQLQPVWSLALRTANDWVQGHVSRTDGSVVSVVSWKSRATYNVYSKDHPSPAAGDRDLVVDPANSGASPNGWHGMSDGTVYTDTRGNNVVATENESGDYEWDGKTRPDGGETLEFSFPLDLSQDPSTYSDAAVVNTFYWNNLLHDVYYQYGFTEDAGNFQEENFGKGGKDQDSVQAFAQSGDG